MRTFPRLLLQARPPVTDFVKQRQEIDGEIAKTMDIPPEVIEPAQTTFGTPGTAKPVSVTPTSKPSRPHKKGKDILPQSKTP